MTTKLILGGGGTMLKDEIERKYRICRYCIMKYGIKGSELSKKHLETDEDLANHIEEVHGIPVIRERETEQQCLDRCAKKGIITDREKCKCQECKELRGEF